jgi:hypothetical protein
MLQSSESTAQKSYLAEPPFLQLTTACAKMEHAIDLHIFTSYSLSAIHTRQQSRSHALSSMAVLVHFTQQT